MALFCPFGGAAAATLRFLGKEWPTGVDRWKFAEKAAYLNTADSHHGCERYR
jgi:hypothetical protein